MAADLHCGFYKLCSFFGVNRVEDASRKRGYRLVGDVAFEEVSEVASMITPVPGGVGPMTITMLLKSTVNLSRKRLK